MMQGNGLYRLMEQNAAQEALIRQQWAIMAQQSRRIENMQRIIDRANTRKPMTARDVIASRAESAFRLLGGAS